MKELERRTDELFRRLQGVEEVRRLHRESRRRRWNRQYVHSLDN